MAQASGLMHVCIACTVKRTGGKSEELLSGLSVVSAYL